MLHQRDTTEVVGTFDKSKKFGFVIPESKKQKEDIFIRKKDFSGAKKGDKVVVQITRYPDQHNSAEGQDHQRSSVVRGSREATSKP